MIYYPVDSIIQLLNNWGQGSILLRHWIKKKYPDFAFARLRIRSVFKHFHSGKRIQEVSDSYRGFTGYVWTEAESTEKKLWSQNIRIRVDGATEVRT